METNTLPSAPSGKKGRQAGTKLYVGPAGERKTFTPGTEPAGWTLAAGTAAASNGTGTGDNRPPVTAQAPVALPDNEEHDIGNGRTLTVYSVRAPGNAVFHGATVHGDLTDYAPDGFAEIGGVLVWIGSGNMPGFNGNRRTLIGQIETVIKAPLVSEEDIMATEMKALEAELTRKRAEMEARIKASLEARRKALNIGQAPAADNGTIE